MEKIKRFLNAVVKVLFIPALIIFVFHIIIYCVIRYTGIFFPVYMVIFYVLLSTVLALYFIIIE